MLGITVTVILILKNSFFMYEYLLQSIVKSPNQAIFSSTSLQVL